MTELQKKIVLLTNLIDRLEYNEKQNSYKLTGTITQTEKKALSDALWNLRKIHK